MDFRYTFQILSGYGGLALATVAVIVIAYRSYPKLEQAIQKSLGEYVNWIVSTRERMFQPVRKSKVASWILISTAAALCIGFYLARGYGVITLVFMIACGTLGGFIPRFWISHQWNQRLTKFDQQLVDALNLMSNSLKSSLNINQVIQVVVEEMPNPLAQEFGLILSQQKVGVTLDEALEKMAQRIPSDDLAVAVHSILILRETGGDLAETFDTIASTIRERRKVDGKIRSMTQQGKTQGLILVLLPFGLAGMLYYINPGFLTPLFTTQIGWMVVLLTIFLQVIGGLWIKKIVSIDV